MKKITLAILALVLVTVTTAFTWQRNDDATKKVTNKAYFEYQETEPGGVNERSNWVKIPESAIDCMDDEGELCTIKAPIADVNDTHPDFTGITDVLIPNRYQDALDSQLKLQSDLIR